jgi:SAM-dependent methyltransferase
VTTAITRDAEGTVTGNTYDKYGSKNPVVKRLMGGFERSLAELFRTAGPRSLLDVGCGEGVLTQQWAQRLKGRVVGIDLEDPALRAEWEKRRAPNLEYRVMKAESLPFADGEFDLAAAIEVLEHVPDPEHTVAEMARVARGGHLLVSVPREPLWRRLPARLRQHARPREPLVQGELHRADVAARRGPGGAQPVPVDHAPCPRLTPRRRRCPTLRRRRTASSAATGAARASSRSASPSPGWSRSRTSRLPATA